MKREQASIVVMGVSGCGKSTIAGALAQALGWPFVEGDALHPADNVARMAAGVPLTDADRAGWLDALGERLAAARREGRPVVMSCSALKRSYRDQLRAHDPHLRLLHLQGDQALLAERLAQRSGHYMPVSLLPSQLATLEPPATDEAALLQDIRQAPEVIVQAALAHFGLATVAP
jgi:carbohydrate kinase (thermoresistant glucokinase family)